MISRILHADRRLDCDNCSICFAGLRQDYVSTPAATALRRGPEPQVMFPSYCLKPLLKTIDDFTAENKLLVSSSSCWQSGLSSLNSSACQSPTSAAKQSCQSPKLSRLHQQVTQFKLLKLAQNQGTICSFLQCLYTDMIYSV